MATGRKVGIVGVATLILAVLVYTYYVTSNNPESETEINITEDELAGTNTATSAAGPSTRDPGMTPDTSSSSSVEDVLNRVREPRIVGPSTTTDASSTPDGTGASATTSTTAPGPDDVGMDDSAADDASSSTTTASTTTTTSSTGFDDLPPYQATSPDFTSSSSTSSATTTDSSSTDTTEDASTSDVTFTTSTGTGVSATTATTATTSAPGSAEYYTIKKGDSFWTIAKSHYGIGKYHQHIADANPSVDPNNLKIGAKIVLTPLPIDAQTLDPVTTATTTRPEPTATDPLGLGLGNDARTVVVLEGEGLWDIAAREYKDGTKWQLIFNANRDKLRDPNVVRAGMKLVVPPLPQ